MTPDIVYNRRQICVKCDQWVANHCKKGHILSSWHPCPEGKFSSYVDEKYSLPKTSLPDCKSCNEAKLRSLTYTEAVAEFYEQMRLWEAAGFPTVTSEVQDARLKKCETCEYYRHFQCSLCRCVGLIKTKLDLMSCPDGRW